MGEKKSNASFGLVGRVSGQLIDDARSLDLWRLDVSARSGFAERLDE